MALNPCLQNRGSLETVKTQSRNIYWNGSSLLRMGTLFFKVGAGTLFRNSKMRCVEAPVEDQMINYSFKSCLGKPDNTSYQ